MNMTQGQQFSYGNADYICMEVWWMGGVRSRYVIKNIATGKVQEVPAEKMHKYLENGKIKWI